MREQATLHAQQPWLAGRENFVITVDKVRMHAASVGGRFVQQSSRKPTYARNMFCGEMNFVMNYCTLYGTRNLKSTGLGPKIKAKLSGTGAGLAGIRFDILCSFV